MKISLASYCSARSDPSAWSTDIQKISVAELQGHLASFLERVRCGETVMITDQNVPVARLEPVQQPATVEDDAARLARLEKAGVIRRGQGGSPLEVLSLPLPQGGGVLDALLEERRERR